MEIVTQERWDTRDHYRAQVNANKAHVAFGYGALQEYFPRPTSEMIRNGLAGVWEGQIETHLRMAFMMDKAFAKYIGEFIRTLVAPEMQPEAYEFFHKLGWQEPLL